MVVAQARGGGDAGSGGAVAERRWRADSRGGEPARGAAMRRPAAGAAAAALRAGDAGGALSAGADADDDESDDAWALDGGGKPPKPKPPNKCRVDPSMCMKTME